MGGGGRSWIVCFYPMTHATLPLCGKSGAVETTRCGIHDNGENWHSESVLSTFQLITELETKPGGGW